MATMKCTATSQQQKTKDNIDEHTIYTTYNNGKGDIFTARQTYL